MGLAKGRFAVVVARAIGSVHADGPNTPLLLAFAADPQPAGAARHPSVQLFCAALPRVDVLAPRILLQRQRQRRLRLFLVFFSGVAAQHDLPAAALDWVPEAQANRLMPSVHAVAAAQTCPASLAPKPLLFVSRPVSPPSPSSACVFHAPHHLFASPLGLALSPPPLLELSSEHSLVGFQRWALVVDLEYLAAQRLRRLDAADASCLAYSQKA